jgi:hypothetical protein
LAKKKSKIEEGNLRGCDESSQAIQKASHTQCPRPEVHLQGGGSKDFKESQQSEQQSWLRSLEEFHQLRKVIIAVGPL